MDRESFNLMVKSFQSLRCSKNQAAWGIKSIYTETQRPKMVRRNLDFLGGAFYIKKATFLKLAAAETTGADF